MDTGVDRGDHRQRNYRQDTRRPIRRSRPHGHHRYSQPGPGRLEDAAGAGARVTDLEEAIDSSEAVVWAINGAAMVEAIPAYGRQLADKVAIDATNNIGAQP